MEHDSHFFLIQLTLSDCTALMSGQVNQIRLHYWSQILDDHKYLMLDEKPIFIEGAP